MALDTLIVGSFEFTDFAVPERLPGGGRQALTIHRMPGGAREIDAWGPDDADRTFFGLIWGADALDQALTLDALRVSGAELPYSNGVEARGVVIGEFTFEVRKFQCVEYRITLVPTDSDGSGGFGFGFGGIDALIVTDLAAAVGLL